MNENIWVDYEEYKAEGVAAVIENKVREFGGYVKDVSIEERAKLISDEERNLININKLLKAEIEGIKLAEDEIKKILLIFKSKINIFKKDAKELYFQIKKDDPRLFANRKSN
ncbi:MAG: hypothetical protein ABI550_07920 [Ignavibacteriaceae bacterium]